MTTHIVAAILCFFFVRYNYPVELFADILHIFTIKSDTCFSDCFFHLELSDFLHGLKAEKQNVGNNRTDSFSLCDGNRSKTNTGAENFHHSFTKFDTPYLECTRTLHQHIKTVFIKNGLLLKCSLTLFRLGFFGQSVTGGGLLGPPLCISGTNNARVMKFTHNDHLRTKKPHTQF